MSPLLLVALLTQIPAQGAGTSVKTSHANIAVDDERYLWVRPGKPLRLQVERKKGEQLNLDIVRLGSPSRVKGSSDVIVRIGRNNEKVRVRPPLEASRAVAGSNRGASYPVRHRFDLLFATNAVRVTVKGGAEGVGIRVSVGKRKRSRLALAPLSKAKKKADRRRRRRGRRASKKASKATTSKTTRSEPAATATSEPAATATSEPAATATSEPAATATATTEPATTEPATTEPATTEPATTVPTPATASVAPTPPGPVPPETRTIEISPETPRARSLPFGIHMGAGAGALGVGGLFPIGLHVGARVLGSVPDGWMSRYEVGLGLDFDFDNTRVQPEGVPVTIDWTVYTGRIRAEGAAKVFETELDMGDMKLPIDVAVIGGLGALIGAHQFQIAKRTETRFAFGPTMRVGAQGAVGVGPGSLTLLVPIDASWDVTSGVQNYVPVVASIFVGYRLEL